MSRFVIFSFTLLIVTFSGLTQAQCHLDGRTYDEGEVVAGYVCDGGKWKEL